VRERGAALVIEHDAFTWALTPRLLVAVAANAEVAPMVEIANAQIDITFKLNIILLIRVIPGIGLLMGRWRFVSSRSAKNHICNVMNSS
jgi:hypothetical protein